MRTLIVSRNLSKYFCKTHEAFHTGMRAMFDARCFGEGYEGYQPGLKSYQDIVQRVFPDAPPDVLFTFCDYPPNIGDLKFDYQGLKEAPGIKTVPIVDFWCITEKPEYKHEFLNWLDRHGVDLVVCYYPQLKELYADTPYADRFIVCYPTFDPALYNDWNLPKTHDIGFIGSGVGEAQDFYPERDAIHKVLAGQHCFSYLWKPHPGNRDHELNHAQVGAGFSRIINSCRMFVATGGRYNLALARYFETLASKSLLLAVEPVGADELHLVDGVNYVKIEPHNVLDKVNYYLQHAELREQIAEAGYRTAMRYHTGHQRALDFYETLKITGLLKSNG